ncbi:MAG TPA: DNA-directed RNA polymerase subunit omega [Acidobacteriaceae bacterium]|nr:DNA-directed RNA polymerase subunit omega [Acidobacteriaceae bacterium]
MRSELIFGALTHVSNRYQLCQLASKATRKLHKPNTRLQDTMNDVLLRFRESSPAAVTLVHSQPVALPQQTQRRAA